MNTTIMSENEKRKDFIVKSVTKHSDSTKMENIISISTSALENTMCPKTCGLYNKCYARKYLSLRKGLRDKCKRNHDFYTSVDLNDNDIPKFNASIMRFESFGELQNMKQIKNYCTICWQNEHIQFSLWTKQLELLKEYEEKGGVFPDNLTIIASSRYINHSDLKYYFEEYEGLFDAVFTVYTKEYALEHNININCGTFTDGIYTPKKCNDCRLCYTHELFKVKGGRLEINEILK